jgi:hypothetical protein
MTGAEYRRKRLTDLDALIAETETDIAEMYASAREEHPFLLALQQQIPALQSTT